MRLPFSTRLLRLQLDAADGLNTIEGFGRRWPLTRAGHYHLKVAKLLVRPEETQELTEVAVPRERVIFVQVLA